MADITTIKVGNDNESSYKLYPVNDEFLKRADEPETPELPAVTAADNGKVLKVNNGKWAAKAEDSELPAVTAADNGKILSVANGVWAATSLSVWQGGSY